MKDTRFPLVWTLGMGVFISLVPVCVRAASDGKPSASRYSVVERELILEASDVARTDGVPARWCGRGTLSVLNSLGLADGLRGADGHDWEESLWEAGWRPMPCSDPLMAPYGSVLVYDSDWRLLGKNKRDTPGGRWGHVEFVAWDEKTGGRVYVSDAPRQTPGGTVLDNFTRRAWVPPCFVELFRRLQKRDLPASGYVYRGRKDENPGTNFIPPEGDFKGPQEYVLLSGRRGYFGRVAPAQSEVGRGDASDAWDSDALPLGPGPLGPNPLFGGPLVYERGSEASFSYPESSSGGVDFQELGGSVVGEGAPLGGGLWAAPVVVEPPEVVKERLDLLLAFRKAEASRLLGGGR